MLLYALSNPNEICPAIGLSLSIMLSDQALNRVRQGVSLHMILNRRHVNYLSMEDQFAFYDELDSFYPSNN